MDVKIHPLQLIPGERCTKTLQWRIKQAKVAVREKWLLDDGTATSSCNCRPSYKLKSIEPTTRSPQEVDSLNNVDMIEKYKLIKLSKIRK